MTPQIIFNSSRKPLALTKSWPAEPKWHQFPGTPDSSDYDIRDSQREDLDKAIAEVIASAVPFKLAEDEATIELAISSKIAKDEHSFCSWKPESYKPYDLPEGLEIEFKLDVESPISSHKKQYAFLKQQPKEQTKVESHDDLWRLAEWLHDTYEKIAIKNHWQTQESTKVKFNDLPIANKNTMLDLAQEIKSKFRIERI